MQLQENSFVPISLNEKYIGKYNLVIATPPIDHSAVYLSVSESPLFFVKAVSLKRADPCSEMRGEPMVK